jgi:hypothetical protein
MTKYFIALILAFTSTLTAQEKPDTVYALGLVNFDAKIAAYEEYAAKLEIEFRTTKNIIEELRKGREAQEASEREIVEIVRLIWQLDTLHVKQFKTLLTRYVDSAVSVGSDAEGNPWVFSATLIFNIRHNLENYIRQQKAKTRKVSNK